MALYDWALVAIACAFLVRGWMRGAVREAIDVAVLLVGSILVFRLSPVIGTIIAGMANVPYEVGRVVAGSVVFVALVVGSIYLGRILAHALRVIPGASALDKLGGSLIGLAFAAIVVVLGTTLLSATPAPASVRARVDSAIGSSDVGSLIVDPKGVVQPAVSVASGERIFGAVIAVRDAVGDRLIAGTLPIPFPSVDEEPLPPSQVAAQSVFDDLNTERISSGLDPLVWSPDLAAVAVARATDVYRSGVLALDDELSAALSAEGVPGTIHGDLVVVAASEDGLVEAILSAPSYHTMVTHPRYHKAGVGVVEGPYGLMAVQVLSG